MLLASIPLIRRRRGIHGSRSLASDSKEEIDSLRPVVDPELRRGKAHLEACEEVVRKEIDRPSSLVPAAEGLSERLFLTRFTPREHVILGAIKQVHETLHAEGTVRLSTAIKLGTRTDKEPTLEDTLFPT